MVQASSASTSEAIEMVTNVEDIVTTNCDTAWMTQIENKDPEVVRALLQEKLTTVPPEAAIITGPRNDRDVSYGLWQKLKK